MALRTVLDGSPPATGECTVLIAWHIDTGRFGAIPPDGLNVALAVDSPGPMTQVKWSAAIYLDSRATHEQRDALTRIFSGQTGGHPAVLASFVGEVLGVKSAAIDYRNSFGDTDSLAERAGAGCSASPTSSASCIAPSKKAQGDIHETIEATCGICLGAKSGSTWRPLGSTNGSYKYAGPRAKSHFGAPEIADWRVTLGVV
jgi:hypothetical protein